MNRTLLVAALCTLSPAALAVDGVIEINHARALAGGITPGDAPGYPVTLSLSGSYRLTGDLTLVDKDTSGIVASANNVTIDLNGFSIAGPNVCGSDYVGIYIWNCTLGGAGKGIQVTGSGAVVRNGRVSGTGGTGVETGDNALVENLLIFDTGGSGIQALGENGIIRGNTITDNAGSGIDAGGQLIQGNMIRDTNGSAIRTTGWTAAISGNHIQTMTSTWGIQCMKPAILRDNAVAGSSQAYAGCIDGGGNTTF